MVNPLTEIVHWYKAPRGKADVGVFDNVNRTKTYNRNSRRDQNPEEKPRTKAQVATMLLRRAIVSPTLCSRTLYRGGPLLPNKGPVRNKLMEAKPTITLIPSMQRLTILATSNASFFFVMGSRVFLWLVVKIW